MLIGGLQKTTLIDYPDKVAATIFTIGCNFRCSFCYNGDIVKGISKVIRENDILDFLNERKKLLDAVCITGGEPTMHRDLMPFLKKIKKLGYLIKLDTNGTKPEVLKRLVTNKLVDYVAMDIKAPWPKYQLVTIRNVDIDKIKRSADFLQQGLVDYEFRSTVLPGLQKEKDILAMARQIKGAKKYFLQQFLPAKKIMDSNFLQAETYTKKKLNEIIQEFKDWFQICRVR